MFNICVALTYSAVMFRVHHTIHIGICNRGAYILMPPPQSHAITTGPFMSSFASAACTLRSLSQPHTHTLLYLYAVYLHVYSSAIVCSAVQRKSHISLCTRGSRSLVSTCQAHKNTVHSWGDGGPTASEAAIAGPGFKARGPSSPWAPH